MAGSEFSDTLGELIGEPFTFRDQRFPPLFGDRTLSAGVSSESTVMLFGAENEYTLPAGFKEVPVDDLETRQGEEVTVMGLGPTAVKKTYLDGFLEAAGLEEVVAMVDPTKQNFLVLRSDHWIAVIAPTD